MTSCEARRTGGSPKPQVGSSAEASGRSAHGGFEVKKVDNGGLPKLQRQEPFEPQAGRAESSTTTEGTGVRISSSEIDRIRQAAATVPPSKGCFAAGSGLSPWTKTATRTEHSETGMHSIQILEIPYTPCKVGSENPTTGAKSLLLHATMLTSQFPERKRQAILAKVTWKHGPLSNGGPLYTLRTQIVSTLKKGNSKCIGYMSFVGERLCGASLASTLTQSRLLRERRTAPLLDVKPFGFTSRRFACGLPNHTEERKKPCRLDEFQAARCQKCQYHNVSLTASPYRAPKTRHRPRQRA